MQRTTKELQAFIDLLHTLEGRAEELALFSHQRRSKLSDTIATEVLAPLVQAHHIIRPHAGKSWDQSRRLGILSRGHNIEKLEHDINRAGTIAVRAIKKARSLAYYPAPESRRLRELARLAERDWPRDIAIIAAKNAIRLSPPRCPRRPESSIPNLTYPLC